MYLLEVTGSNKFHALAYIIWLSCTPDAMSSILSALLSS